MFLVKLLTCLSQPQNIDVDYESIVPFVDFEPGIPKMIVQTCKSIELLPIELIDNINKIKIINNGWQYKLFDDEMILDFIRNEYGTSLLSYYERINPQYGAAKADLFRYLYIYKKGGVYLDIKSSINKNLDDVILSDDTFLFSYWDNLKNEGHEGVGHYSDVYKDYPRGEIPQWFIVSSKGHPLIRRIIFKVLQNIDNYNPYKVGVGWSGVVYTTGPVPYSLILYEYIGKYPHRQIDIFSEAGFEYSIYEKEKKDTTYHAKAIRSDYRKGYKPVVTHRSTLMHITNCFVLKLMRNYRKG